MKFETLKCIKITFIKQIDIITNEYFHILFVGTVGQGVSGDIGLDTIVMWRGEKIKI